MCSKSPEPFLEFLFGRLAAREGQQLKQRTKANGQCGAALLKAAMTTVLREEPVKSLRQQRRGGAGINCLDAELSDDDKRFLRGLIHTALAFRKPRSGSLAKALAWKAAMRLQKSLDSVVRDVEGLLDDPLFGPLLRPHSLELDSLRSCSSELLEVKPLARAKGEFLGTVFLVAASVFVNRRTGSYHDSDLAEVIGAVAWKTGNTKKTGDTSSSVFDPDDIEKYRSSVRRHPTLYRYAERIAERGCNVHCGLRTAKRAPLA